MRLRTWLLFVLITTATVNAQQPSTPAQKPPSDAPKSEAPKKEEPKKEETKPAPEEKPVVRQHQVTVNGKTLKYTTTTGMMPIKNTEGETEANIFYMAYTLDQPAGAAKRPLMFSFNGGPGSSSVWLHLGVLGPKRVKLNNEGAMLSPPFQLVENDYTMLDQTDLVFIDPVGTGYSRPTKKDLGKKFWGLKGDIQSVGEFIRMYLTRNERWGSPLFLIGESYGTMRAAGLAGSLFEQGIALNGIALISSTLVFQTIDFVRGNDWPYILYLPTYTATAWYHKKLPADLQKDLPSALKAAEQWAGTTYLQALAKGDALAPAERREIAAQLARFTGLSQNYVELSNLRIEHVRFATELLRDQGATVGRLDSRFRGKNELGVAENFDYDPSYSNILGPYTATLNSYVRSELGYQSDVPYTILGGLDEKWEWGDAGAGMPNTAAGLRSAFVQNPYMKVYIASGYYDMATPYFATKYTFEHIGLDAAAKKNISSGEFESGHMMYIHMPSLEKLRKELGAFMNGALAR
jgi:carboxypeptidase C (cathepsin A)